MSPRHALVVHTRMPAFDRDSGSQDVDNMMHWLLEAGWTVTFLSQEGPNQVETRHADRLRRMGVATFEGFDWLPKLLRSYDFDLALVAFWYHGVEVLEAVREHSPATRVVVNSMDLHFLRHARLAFGDDGELDAGFGRTTTDELNLYSSVDAVIAVSDKERDLIADLVGRDRVYTLTLAERIERSTVPLAERVGMCFVGNFRHVPNREAIVYMAQEVLPRIDPDLLVRHPLTVLGNHLDRISLDVDATTAGLNLVGWVPAVEPYLHRARATVVPLLHGAGVKRKVLQSMMAFTPVVSTPVGVEGVDIIHGRHVLIARDADGIAAALTRVLTDDDLWHSLADEGARLVDGQHGLHTIGLRFQALIEQVMATEPRSRRTPRPESTSTTTPHTTAASIRQRVSALSERGSTVLVISEGDEALVDLGTQPGWHFPQSRDGGWGGFEPPSDRAAISHLDAQRHRGARYLVVPTSSDGWRSRLPGFFVHLDTVGRCVYRDDEVAIHDLDVQSHVHPPAMPLELSPETTSVLVVGTIGADRAGPSDDLVTELESTDAITVNQVWRHAAALDPDEAIDLDPDFTVYLDDNAVLPAGFLASFIELHRRLDVERLQPAHHSGPTAGPPVTERHRGLVAREVDRVTPMPVLSVRAGAARTGIVTLADATPIGLREAIGWSTNPDRYSDVRRVWATDDSGRPRAHVRPEPARQPEISVLIATFNRPQLLRTAVESFADQTIDPGRYEVVIVDDGSDHGGLEAVVAEYGGRMQIVSLKIAHGGRSAAKNIAVMLARAPIVLFFDDDDLATPDLLERHIGRHASDPALGACVLGRTEWAPELEVGPLMHFVTEVDRLLFSYGNIDAGQSLGWRHFWEGRVSCKRLLLVRHGLHDQRLNYSIDLELAWRLAPHGLRVVYEPAAESFMARSIDFESFCDRTQAKGAASAVIAALHSGSEIGNELDVVDETAFYRQHCGSETEVRMRVRQLERGRSSTDPAGSELFDSYRTAFRLLRAKGAVSATTPVPPAMPTHPTVRSHADVDRRPLYDASPPQASAEPVLTITIPVWSRTAELARMAEQTIDRVWEASRIPTEIIAIDNGSDHPSELHAKVFGYEENRGVATAWNAGMQLASAENVCILNSDCRVEPGWDEALVEAVTEGRRIAFPYTDHCDGRGYAPPDQGGTSGWCFALTTATYAEIGDFDERFDPAFGEDTDYWHRAWRLDVALEPVPAARVVHARRTTARTDHHVDRLLMAHRHKYGWKHGVDPLSAPPYYHRQFSDFVGSCKVPPDDE